HYTFKIAQIVQDLFGTTKDEHRLTAPFRHHLLARFDLADIHLHRCTCGLGLGAREPGPHKRDRGTHRSCRTYHRGSCNQEATPASIHAVIAHSVVSHQLCGLLVRPLLSKNRTAQKIRQMVKKTPTYDKAKA